MSSAFSEKSTKFSKNLDKLRNLLGLKTSGLEKYLGLSNGYINNFLKTDAENPGKLLIALNEKGISTDWFLTGEGAPFKTLSGIPPGASLGVGPPGTSPGIALPGAGIGPPANSRSVANLDKGGAVRPASEASSGAAKSYRVPVLKQRVSCGPGMEWETEDNIEEMIEIDAFIPRLGLGRVFATKARGSSMRGADIREGDFLFFDAGADFRPVDGIYIFALDGDVYCKRLEFDKLAHKIKIFSVRIADLDKAELVTALNTEDDSFPGRFRIFGRVIRCIRLVNIERE